MTDADGGIVPLILAIVLVLFMTPFVFVGFLIGIAEMRIIISDAYIWIKEKIKS